ncbi:hypothetical protein JCM10207_006533 [Rhodosporidiobolus poonsookiae]
MVSLRLNTSPRVPSFSGPMALAAALLLVSVFSEPYWQNFYIVQAKAANSTLKLGAWGACTRYRNTTGVTGPTTFCTSHTAGYEYNFVANTSENGVNNFPLVADDATLFGTNSADPDATTFVIGSGATSVYWIHVVAAILALLCMLSLLLPPSYLGSETSRLFALQKSGIVTILLAITSCIIAFIAFIVEIVVAIPARNRLGSVDGIDASLGNVQWFALPSAILMLPAIFSVLLRSTVQTDYDNL